MSGQRPAAAGRCDAATDQASSGAPAARSVEAAERREIGRCDSGRPGPTLLVSAGIHGNEPAGVHALRRVFDVLTERGATLRGCFVGFAGNLPALAERRRFLARDLNRGWSAAAIERLFALPVAQRSPEDRQQLELLRCFDEVIADASGPVLFVDLHTSSAPGSPFLCLADTIDNRRLGLATGVPIILGIEENIDGASLEWFADRGLAGFAVEGGQHDDPAAIDNHEAVLWILLDRLGITPPDFLDLRPFRSRLAQAVGSAPPIVEIVYRHVIAPEDRFVMEPGFVNFAKVAKGELLARDRRGELRAPRACHVMLPLYQALGDDGYFLAREVRGVWMWLAKVLRSLPCAALLPLLPGIRPAPDDRDTLLVDPRIARWFAVELFHLLGYRKERPRGERLAFSRRRSLRQNRKL